MSVMAGQPHVRTFVGPRGPSVKTWALHLLLLITMTMTVVVWGVAFVAGSTQFDLEKHLCLVGFFGVACAYFVISRVKSNRQALFELPVFMTLLTFMQFGLAPLINFLYPETLPNNLHGDTSLYQPVLLMVMAGMAAFWLGATIARSKKMPPDGLDTVALLSKEDRALTLTFGVCLYAVSFAMKVFLIEKGMYAYTGSARAYDANLAAAQVWNVMAHYFGIVAVVLFAIEKTCHPKDRFRAVMFWFVLASELFWGLLSGMKGQLLFNFFAVFLVISLTKRKFAVQWLAAAFLGAVIIYPINDHYRAIVRARSSDSLNSVSAATQALGDAALAASRRDSTAGGYVSTGWVEVVSRMNLLHSAVTLVAYKDRAYMLGSGEHLWMIPFYPLIPRLLWPGKPQELMGEQFTALLGRGTGGTALTTFASLYVLYGGLPAVLLGLFLIGMAVQFLTNLVVCSPCKRNIFVYCCMFASAGQFENDFFASTTGSLRTLLIAGVLALILYGSGRSFGKPGAKRKAVDRAPETGPWTLQTTGPGNGKTEAVVPFMRIESVEKGS